MRALLKQKRVLRAIRSLASLVSGARSIDDGQRHTHHDKGTNTDIGIVDAIGVQNLARDKATRRGTRKIR